VGRLIRGLAVPAIILGAVRPAWPCPGCRAQVESRVYGEAFTTTLLVVLLPLALLALVGAGLYYADEIRRRLKGGGANG